MKRFYLKEYCDSHINWKAPVVRTLKKQKKG